MQIDTSEEILPDKQSERVAQDKKSGLGKFYYSLFINILQSNHDKMREKFIQ